MENHHHKQHYHQHDHHHDHHHPHHSAISISIFFGNPSLIFRMKVQINTRNECLIIGILALIHHQSIGVDLKCDLLHISYVGVSFPILVMYQSSNYFETKSNFSLIVRSSLANQIYLRESSQL